MPDLTGPVAVVGAGMVGTSIALACRHAGLEVLLDDAAPRHLRTAVGLGAGRPVEPGDSPELVVVAVPPAHLAETIVACLGRWPGAVVTDVGSVKTAPLEAVAALREQGLGVLEGRLTKELVPEPTPEGLDITEVRWGGGESIEDVHDRLGTFFERVLPAAPPHLVLVTHGDTLRVARAWLQGRGHREVDWDLVPNGGVTTLAVEAGRLRDQERLSRHQRRASGRTAGPESIRSAH